jgi:hypothetical protein
MMAPTTTSTMPNVMRPMPEVLFITLECRLHCHLVQGLAAVMTGWDPATGNPLVTATPEKELTLRLGSNAPRSKASPS